MACTHILKRQFSDGELLMVIHYFLGLHGNLIGLGLKCQVLENDRSDVLEILKYILKCYDKNCFVEPRGTF